MILKYLEQPKCIPLAYCPDIKGERTFTLEEDITVTLSDSYVITIPKGTTTDLASVPNWAWSILKPIDKGFIGDLIHDYLWMDKFGQVGFFDGSLYKARLFADEERLKWRKALATKKWFHNYLTHYIIRLLGGFFYSHQFKIPD